MAKPRRNTAEAFYDVFADFSLEDQAAALKILEQVHRLAKRETGRQRKQVEPPVLPATGTKLFADDKEVKSISDLDSPAFVLKGGPMSQDDHDVVKPLFDAAKEQA
jgi:hypothetical protein